MSQTGKRVAAIVACCLLIGTGVYEGLSSITARQDSISAKQAALSAQQKITASVARAVCIAGNQNNAQLRSLLSFFEGRTLQSPNLTTTQRRAIISFYTDALKRLPPPQNCP